MKKTLGIEITLNVIRRIHGDKFIVTCKNYEIQRTSTVSFEDAENKIIDYIENKIWQGEYFIEFKIYNK